VILIIFRENNRDGGSFMINREKKSTNKKLKYQSPQAVKLEQVENGTGYCEGSGSGDTEICVNFGNAADYSCAAGNEGPNSPP
jgi:hypothetical protein